MCSNSRNLFHDEGAMAESGTNERKVVLGVDASEHSERAFDCK